MDVTTVTNMLEYYEQKIQASFDEIGHALRMIRERKLYESAGYLTFDAYVKERWQRSGSWARQLIMTERVQLALLDDGITLDNARHARELVQFDEDLRPTIARIAYSVASSQDRPATARDIKVVGTVLTDLAYTGHVDTGDGSMAAFDAALVGEAYEVAMRQREYIRSNRPPSWQTQITAASDGTVQIALPPEYAGKQVTIFVRSTGDTP